MSRPAGVPAHGIQISAGVVTRAAIIMEAVFSVFATLSMTTFKQLGVGLAVAIFLDATVVRAEPVSPTEPPTPAEEASLAGV